MSSIQQHMKAARVDQRAPLLEVRNLSVRYPLTGLLTSKLRGVRQHFLDAVIGVGFALRDGRTMALVGESGSGKSSLGRAIVGLLPLASGQVLFQGRDPFATRRSNRQYHRDVAMMFQDAVSSLSPRRNVRALLTEPFIIHRMHRKELTAEIDRLLGLVGLPKEFAERYPHQLSGGQARRVGVARAIALNPKLIVADEPTAGLDVSVQADILNLLMSLQQEFGLSYLIITHNLALVRHISDETAIMYMGRFVELGPTAEIFARPAHPYTEALLLAQPQTNPDLRRQEAPLLGEVPSLLARPSGCEFHTRCTRSEAICRSQLPALSSIAPQRSCRCFFTLS